MTTLHVGVLEPAGTPSEDLRLAMVWQLPDVSGRARPLLGQDIALPRAWPVHAALELAPSPPEAAIASVRWGDPGTPVGRRATAKIVVYEDRNRNGRLDTIPVGSNVGVDALRAADDALYLEWIDATDADLARNPTLGGFTRGMNLVRRPALERPAGPECVDKPCDRSREPVVRLSSDDEVILSTRVTPVASAMLCERFIGVDATNGDINTPCPSPTPAGAGIECVESNRAAYLVVTFTLPVPTCSWRGVFGYCGVRRDPALATPAEWPCP